MRSDQFIDALQRKFGADSDQSLRRALGLSATTLSKWRAKRSLTPRMMADLVNRLATACTKGEPIVEALMRKLQCDSLRSLASELGITYAAIHGWRWRREVTPRQIASLLSSAKAATQKKLECDAIRPLVEFFPLTKDSSGKGGAAKLFPTGKTGKDVHPYLDGLRKELEKNHGVYVFFDSRGHAIYAGKARRQTLWKELNLVLHRSRGSLQRIRRVSHPSRKQKYKTHEEQSRQITERSVSLNEIAAYFSAYKVTDGMVNVVESLMVRCFANDLLNKRMEQFASRAKTIAKKKKVKRALVARSSRRQ